jgi:hypothetical protein
LRKVFERRRRLAALCALALAGLAATAAPADAGRADGLGLLGCEWTAGADTFSSIGRLLAAGAARGSGEAREPALNDVLEEVPASARGKGGRSFRAAIPVWFHVVTDGAAGNVTRAQIDAQITVLNVTFGGGEGGVDTGFRFRLAGVTRTNNAAWFAADPGTKDERDMKHALRRGGADTLNYYSTTAGGFLGWAYFPSTYHSRPYIDGIVVDWESMPGTSTKYAGQYDQGETATHEAGHWLGLYHTFQGGCNAKGDHVDDTPPMRVPTSGCPAGKDTCREPGLDPIHNYMDYSFDSCYFEFTAGQAARMQDQYLFYRAGR